MDRKELIARIKEEYDVEPDYPFPRDYAEAAVFRHRDTGKWFALCMKVRRDRLGYREEEEVDVLTLKAEPLLIDGSIARPGFHRAYHMNKKQWMTIELAEQVSDRGIMSLVDMSFGLTKKKLKRRKKEEQYIAEVRK